MSRKSYESGSHSRLPLSVFTIPVIRLSKSGCYCRYYRFSLSFECIRASVMRNVASKAMAAIVHITSTIGVLQCNAILGFLPSRDQLVRPLAQVVGIKRAAGHHLHALRQQ